MDANIFDTGVIQFEPRQKLVQRLRYSIVRIMIVRSFQKGSFFLIITRACRIGNLAQAGNGNEMFVLVAAADLK